MSWLDEAKSKKQRDDLLKQQQEERREQRRKSFYDSLSPLVQRLLTDLGNAYWGVGWHNASLYEYYDWSIQKDGAVRLDFIFLVNLVLPEDTQHYVSTYQTEFGRDATAPFFEIHAAKGIILTQDTSETSLKEALIEAFESGPYRTKS